MMKSIVSRVRPILECGTQYRLIPLVLVQYRYRKTCFDTSTDTEHTSRV